MQNDAASNGRSGPLHTSKSCTNRHVFAMAPLQACGAMRSRRRGSALSSIGEADAKLLTQSSARSGVGRKAIAISRSIECGVQQADAIDLVNSGSIRPSCATCNRSVYAREARARVYLWVLMVAESRKTKQKKTQLGASQSVPICQSDSKRDLFQR